MYSLLKWAVENIFRPHLEYVPLKFYCRQSSQITERLNQETQTIAKKKQQRESLAIEDISKNFVKKSQF